MYSRTKYNICKTQGELKNRLINIEKEISDICNQCGRKRNEITVLSVSKYVPNEIVDIAYRLGVRNFGENRIEKFENRKKLSFFNNCSWDMIGHIQSRKVNKIVGQFSLIHSIDTIKVARLVNKFACEKQICQPVLLQVNTSNEESKQGFISNFGVLERDNIFACMDELAELPGLDIQGFMTMAPNTNDKNLIQSVFHDTKVIRDKLQNLYPQLNLKHLSMGMSNDFKLALLEGATIVRIGSRLFIK
ncbi:YggS family pyridoxal phosphate-dependent enzyme [Clostridium pasteurianum]|nr:YggS family pyridoxal phosphate-dependent enzyme [Clostridium pasteurianum]